MVVRPTSTATPEVLTLLREAYRFVAVTWPRVPRDLIPDQGFERRLREAVATATATNGWTLAPASQFEIDAEPATASGVLHEVDLVARHADAAIRIVVEAKNWGHQLGKNEIIVFFAKLLDFFAGRPNLLERRVGAFVASAGSFDESGLQACVGLGMHPIAPDVRPFPVLVDTARRMAFDLTNGFQPSVGLADDLDDFGAAVNRLGVGLEPLELPKRLAYKSDREIVIRAVDTTDVAALAARLRQLSGVAAALLERARAERAQRGA
jgi:hypothetical protein